MSNNVVVVEPARLMRILLLMPLFETLPRLDFTAVTHCLHAVRLLRRQLPAYRVSSCFLVHIITTNLAPYLLSPFLDRHKSLIRICISWLSFLIHYASLVLIDLLHFHFITQVIVHLLHHYHSRHPSLLHFFTPD